MKLSTLIQSKDAISKIGQLKLRAKLAYDIAKIIKQVEEEFTNFDKIRIKKIQDYGNKKKDGTFEIKNEKTEIFSNEIQELLDSEIDLKFNQLHISELGDLEIEAQTLMALDWLFKSC